MKYTKTSVTSSRTLLEDLILYQFFSLPFALYAYI